MIYETDKQAEIGKFWINRDRCVGYKDECLGIIFVTVYKLEFFSIALFSKLRGASLL